VNNWIRKFHIYAGLLNFSVLIVFGVAGLAVTFDAPDIFHAGNHPRAELQPFVFPGSLSDKQIADLIAQKLKPAHAGPPNAHRDPETQQLIADFYSVNGLVRVTALEQTISFAFRRIATASGDSSITRMPLPSPNKPQTLASTRGHGTSSSPSGR
jgi:hypothetical protein